MISKNTVGKRAGNVYSFYHDVMFRTVNKLSHFKRKTVWHITLHLKQKSIIG